MKNFKWSINHLCENHFLLLFLSTDILFHSWLQICKIDSAIYVLWFHHDSHVFFLAFYLQCLQNASKKSCFFNCWYFLMCFVISIAKFMHDISNRGFTNEEIGELGEGEVNWEINKHVSKTNYDEDEKHYQPACLISLYIVMIVKLWGNQNHRPFSKWKA